MSDDSVAVLQRECQQQEQHQSSMSSAIIPQQRGQCIKPDAVQTPSFGTSVVELMHDVMPQSSSTSKPEQERIDWVSFQKCDLSDPQWKSELESINGYEPPVILILGLARGYQIWALMANGDCEELLSDRQGPVKSANLLPYPQPCFGVTEVLYASKRPLIAICDALSAVGGRQYCTIGIVSIRLGDQCHALRFEEPVYTVQCSSKVLLISFGSKLLVCDTMSFTKQMWIKSGFHGDDPLPFSLSNTWLAYADNKLSTLHQSCGGATSVEPLPSYTSQMLNVAKNLGKTVTAFGESFASSLSGGAQVVRQSTISQTANINPGIVTVIDLKSFPKAISDIHCSTDVGICGIIGHFVAHLDEQITALQFAPNCSLLLTVGTCGQYFNLFSLSPHPGSSSMTAVHHLYSLYRGSTPAKAEHITFSADTRWVSVTTNHGTTHTFPITPYGGPVNVRTHNNAKLVNRESTFHRTAGLDVMEQTALRSSSSTSPPTSNSPGSTSPQTPAGSQKGSPSSRDFHPSQNTDFPSLSLVSSNSRVPPYPQPLLIQSHAKIKQRLLSSSNLSARAVDLAPTSLVSNSGKTTKTGTQLSQLSVVFAPSVARAAFNQNVPTATGETPLDSLIVMNCEGQLSEYCMSVKAGTTAVSSKITAQSPIALSVTPAAQWRLERNKSSPDVRPPLPQTHPLVMANKVAAEARLKCSQTSNVGFNRRDVTNTDKTSPRSNTPPRSWIAQVEMITYQGPNRRLWMGPQFTFKTYMDSDHVSTDLVSPTDRKSKKKNAKRVERSEPMEMPISRTTRTGSGRSVPVVIEATSGSFDHRIEGVTMEVCGSWSDNDYISCDEQEGRLRESIAEAMKEQPPTNISKTGGPHCVSGDREDDPCPMEDARSSFSESPSHDSLQFLTSIND